MIRRVTFRRIVAARLGSDGRETGSTLQLIAERNSKVVLRRRRISWRVTLSMN